MTFRRLLCVLLIGFVVILNGCYINVRDGSQELRDQVRELQRDNDALRRELHELREEIGVTDSADVY